MNLEGISLKVLTKELRESLEGGRIFRVFMPAKNSLLLLINKDNATVNFLADFSGDSPLVYLPETLPERPNVPPVFCMLLRKHLEEGRITKVAQKGLDRVITLSIDMIGQGQQIITKHLILELTGKDSNVIFTDEHNIIQDAMRHIGKAQSSFRQILPGLEYVAPPEQTGLDFLTTASGAIVAAVDNRAKSSGAQGAGRVVEENEKKNENESENESAVAGSVHADGQPILGRLITATTGIGKNTALEILGRCGVADDAVKLTPQQSLGCQEAMESIQQEINHCLTSEDYSVYGLINQRQVIKVLVPYKPVCTDNATVKVFPSLLAALAYSSTLVPLQIPDKENLIKVVKTALTKAKKKDSLLAKDFAAAEKADEQKIKADTLMANIYQIKKVPLCAP